MVYNIAFTKKVINKVMKEQVGLRPNYWGFFKMTDVQFDKILELGETYVYTLFMFLLIVGLFKPHYVRLPLAFICLQLMLIHKKKGNQNVYRFLRKMSMLNYFMHMLFVFLFFDLLGIFLQDVWLFIAVAVVTTIASCCLILGWDRFYAYKSLG